MVDVEELLIEILVRLPPKCLPRFQLVSKKWFSIISSRLHSRLLPAAVTGLFFAYPRHIPPFPGPLFVSLKGPDENPQHTQQLSYRLNGVCGGGPIVSLNSCNGLLCVWSLDENGFNSFYVFNPTTNQRRRIPHPSPLINNKRYEIPHLFLCKGYEIRAMNIAFDPSKSHHYNLVCVYNYNHKIGFSLFSSESRVWRDSDEQLAFEFSFGNKPGAFCNGAIHWYCIRDLFLCFDVDNARLRPMPCSPLSPGRRCMYFGECGGHLHFIEQHKDEGSSPLMNVFEMENDYSQWVFKYQVDLSYLRTRFYPGWENGPLGFPAFGVYGYSTIGFSIHLFVLDDEGKEGLVISFPRKIVLYDLHDMSIKQLTVWPEIFSELAETTLGSHSSCKYVETLAYV